uniref:Uncharacterized protein n=1 Tax=Lactuca sativa TaxID=4236 RepID=A0A9R1XFS5_LACSA|nr:hypothetical protein LSAT_V11C500262870 [Lactuca sativa]
MTKERQPLRKKMSPTDEEMTSSYYMSWQEYVYGERKSVPSPVRDNFRRQDESSSSTSSSGRSDGRSGRSGKPKLEEVLKRLHALEQHVFMNLVPTEVFVEEFNGEEIWNQFNFDDPLLFQTNIDQTVVEDEGMNKNKSNENVFGENEENQVIIYITVTILIINNFMEFEERNDNTGCRINKFDDDIFILMMIKKTKRLFYFHLFNLILVLEEEDPIITGNVNYYDDYVIDGKENTPVKPRTRNPSKYICTPYIELHRTPKQKRRPKKKVDTKLSSPVPPPKFAVVHDFSVQHRFFNLVLDRDFWSALFGHTHDGWLDASHITIWYRLLDERRFDSDRHTIMPPNFFVCHVLEEGYDWRAFMSGIARYPDHMVAWCDVDMINQILIFNIIFVIVIMFTYCDM